MVLPGPAVKFDLTSGSEWARVPLLALFVGAMTLFSVETSLSQPFKVRLQSREFVPPAGLDPDLQQKFGRTNLVLPIHGILQLFRPASPTDHAALSSAGIKLQGSLGGASYLADFSRKDSLDGLTNLVRWAGLLLPEDKVEKSLWDGRIERWARTETGRVKILAVFYSEVPTAEARKVLLNFSDDPQLHRSPSEWAIEISPEKIKALAAEPPIRWLQQGPLPFLPLSR